MSQSESRERLDLIPPQTYKYSSAISSLSLGQGMPKITPESPFDLKQALERLDLSPNDTWTWAALPEAKPEDLPDLVARLKTRPTSAVLYTLIPFLGQNSEATEALYSLGREKAAHLYEGIPPVLVLDPDRIQIEPAWNKIRSLNREKLIPITDLPHIKTPIPKHLLPNDQERPTVLIQVIKEVYDRELRNLNTAVSENVGTSMRNISPENTIEQVTQNPILQSVTQGQRIIQIPFCGTYALVLPWKVDWKVNFDRINYHVTGMTGCSGKGLSPEATTASGFMELAERISAIVGATPGWPRGYKSIDRMMQAKYSELNSENVSVLDPNSLSPKVTYQDQEIYWIKAQLSLPDKNGDVQEIWVPAQKVFHFPNLDEFEFVRDTSNGLASGNTLEEAKLHALLEIIERDGCYTTFITNKKIFSLPPDTTDELGKIIATYHNKGLKPGFIDLTTDFGVPTYRAYLRLSDGNILTGSGAHLNGRIALNRAICELGAKCIGAINQGISLAGQNQQIQERGFSDIPNLSTGNVNADLYLMEKLFELNDYPVIYADLTRKDINIPVVRAIVPEVDSPFSLTRREVKHFIEAS